MLYEPEYGVGRYGARDQRLVPASRPIGPVAVPVGLYGSRPGPPPDAMYGRAMPRYGPVGPRPDQYPPGQKQFPVLYLGSTWIEQSYYQGSEPSMQDVATVVGRVMRRTDNLRREGTRLKTYVLHVGLEKISFMLVETRDVQHIPINKVHFVAADPRDPCVFSLVARGRGNRFLCHVFECSSTDQCDSITKTVSDAFRLAYEKWLHVEENQRRLEERRAREMDMGGLEYFQEYDDYAPRGMPLYNISSYYNSGSNRPRQYLRPRDELPRLPERLIVSRSNQGGNREPEPEPYSMRYNFDDDEYDDSPQEEVYVRQDLNNGRRGGSGRQQPVVFDIRPDWE